MWFRSSDQMKVLKAQSAQTTTTAVGIRYRLWSACGVQSAQLNKVKEHYIYIYIYNIYI